MENPPNKCGLDDSALDNQQQQQKQDEIMQQQVPPAVMMPAPVMPMPHPDFMMAHTQLELGHSLVRGAYPYPDSYYGGIVAAYGPQSVIHPHILAVPHTGVPLPSDAIEEPVYVNAKQYHGILRRRQSRAKAESENKLVKCRKPYLHESRHLHAIKRPRGCGGRFLNAKNMASQDDGVSQENNANGNTGQEPDVDKSALGKENVSQEKSGS